MVQELPLKEGGTGKCLCKFEDKVFVGVEMHTGDKKKENSTIFYLLPVPSERQIQKLILQTRIDEAQKVFQQNNKPSSSDYTQKLEKFNTEAAWALMKNLEFEKAAEFFAFTDFDPRELILLIPGLLILSKHYERLQDIYKLSKIKRLKG